jgi:hypothetical protein
MIKFYIIFSSTIFLYALNTKSFNIIHKKYYLKTFHASTNQDIVLYYSKNKYFIRSKILEFALENQKNSYDLLKNKLSLAQNDLVELQEIYSSNLQISEYLIDDNRKLKYEIEILNLKLKEMNRSNNIYKNRAILLEEGLFNKQQQQQGSIQDFSHVVSKKIITQTDNYPNLTIFQNIDSILYKTIGIFSILMSKLFDTFIKYIRLISNDNFLHKTKKIISDKIKIITTDLKKFMSNTDTNTNDRFIVNLDQKFTRRPIGSLPESTFLYYNSSRVLLTAS